MILNDKELAERQRYYGEYIQDYLDTIADLKRQLAEAHAQLGLWGYKQCKERLDAYVQEEVAALTTASAGTQRPSTTKWTIYKICPACEAEARRTTSGGAAGGDKSEGERTR